MEKIFILLLVLATTLRVSSLHLWQNWSSLPKEVSSLLLEETAYNDCNCHSTKNCALTYRIMRDMIDFMQIHGMISDEEANLQRKEINISEHISKKAKEKFKKARLRQRINSRPKRQTKYPRRECCCPPQTIVSPTFFTRKRFLEAIDRMMNDNKNNTKTMEPSSDSDGNII